MIKEFAEYIEDNTSLTVGTDLYAGSRPSSDDGASTLIEESEPGIRDPHPGLSDMGTSLYRIEVRGANTDGYMSTRDTAYTIFNALHAATQVTLPIVADGNEYVVNINCSEPYSIGPDERGRNIIIIRAAITKQVTN